MRVVARYHISAEDCRKLAYVAAHRSTEIHRNVRAFLRAAQERVCSYLRLEGAPRFAAATSMFVAPIAALLYLHVARSRETTATFARTYSHGRKERFIAVSSAATSLEAR
jgi:hypothetical protein